MRNDLFYLRFYWDRPEDEVLPDDVPDAAARRLAIAIRDGVASLTGGGVVTVRVERQGPPRHYCIELAYVADIAAGEGMAAWDLAKHGWEGFEAFRKWANDNEGLVGVGGLLLMVLLHPEFWKLVQRQRQPGDRSDVAGEPERFIAVTIGEELLRRRKTAKAVYRMLDKLLESNATRIEVQFRSDAPGRIDPAAARGTLAADARAAKPVDGEANRRAPTQERSPEVEPPSQKPRSDRDKRRRRRGKGKNEPARPLREGIIPQPPPFNAESREFVDYGELRPADLPQASDVTLEPDLDDDVDGPGAPTFPPRGA